MATDLHRWVVSLHNEVLQIIRDNRDDKHYVDNRLSDICTDLLMVLASAQASYAIDNYDGGYGSIVSCQKTWSGYKPHSSIAKVSSYYSNQGLNPGVLDIANRFFFYVNLESQLITLGFLEDTEGVGFEDPGESTEIDLDMLFRVVYEGIIDKGAMLSLHCTLNLLSISSPDSKPSELFHMVAINY